MSATKPADCITIFESQPELLKAMTALLCGSFSKFSKTKIEPNQNGQVAKEQLEAGAVIRFEGETLTMEIFLGLPKELANQLTRAAFPMMVDQNQIEQQDLSGELLNVAFGVLDPAFSKLGHKMRSSFPKALNSQEQQSKLKNARAGKLVSVPLTIDGSAGLLEIYPAGAVRLGWKYTNR